MLKDTFTTRARVNTNPLLYVMYTRHTPRHTYIVQEILTQEAKSPPIKVSNSPTASIEARKKGKYLPKWFAVQIHLFNITPQRPRLRRSSRVPGIMQHRRRTTRQHAHTQLPPLMIPLRMRHSHGACQQTRYIRPDIAVDVEAERPRGRDLRRGEFLLWFFLGVRC